MSETTGQTQTDPLSASREFVEMNTPKGAGAMLRRAREAQGLHIAALAVSLKVPVRKLEALEADRYDLLPDVVFVRALTLSVCRTLKLDSQAVMAALPQRRSPSIKTDDEGLNTTLQSPANLSGLTLHRVLNPVGLAIIAMLLIIVAIAFWPVQIQQTAADVAVAEAGTSAASGVDQGSEASVMSSEPVKLTDSPALSATADPKLVVASEVQPLTVPAATDALLVIRAMGESWIEVTDARNVSQLRKVTGKGEVLTVDAVPPLTVVVGRADMISATARGKVLDLTAISKNNVARFEVN